MQVWWYVGGCFTSELAVHNLAKNETKAVKTNRNMPAVTVMAQVLDKLFISQHLHGCPHACWHTHLMLRQAPPSKLPII